MTQECIHGLEFNRCDLCSPQAPPAPSATATAAPRTRTPRASTTRTTAGSATARPLRQGKPINIGEQRIHHLTHIDNLAGILARGLHSDASDESNGRPEVDISSADTREARRNTAVIGAGTTVAEYVPFFLTPNATLWEGIRARTADPRISAAARRLPSAEFVLLVTTIKHLSEVMPEGSIVVTDGDAADPRSRFAAEAEDSERMLRRLLSESEPGPLQRAEFLVHGTVPFEVVTLIGVANDKARSAVRSILVPAGHSPRLAVHPPWFALPEAI